MSNASDETQIRHLVDLLAQAIRTKNVDAVMAHYAPDLLSFDLAPPLQHRGEAVRRGLEAWFPSFRGPVGYEIRDLAVTAGSDVAFCHSLNRISGARTSGEQTDVWVRATIGLRKIAGRWLVTHEHASVPFYMQPPYIASLDLQP